MRARVERTNVETRLRRVADAYGKVLVLVVAALPAGVVAGAVDALFGRVLLAVSGVRAGWPLLTVPFLAVAGALTAWAYRRFGKGAERGMGLVFGAAHGQDVLPWDWVLKLALTVLTLSAGYQGGEVTPLFSIGACLGVALAGPLGLPVALAAALGYAAVFGAATNTFLAPLLIGGEVFGWANLPAFFVVCAAAYLFNMGKTIYAGQLPG